MLKVGIHENLVITKTTKNDQGTLVIGFKEAGEVDLIAAMNSSDSVSFDKNEQDLLIYPPKLENMQGETKTADVLMKDIADVRDPLNKILQQYKTKDSITWDIFAGTGLTAGDDFNKKLTTQGVIDKVYSNIVDQFIAQMAPFVGESGKKMRVLFIRQSKAKHYPRLRTKFLDSNPFIEPMVVPKAQSKVKFTKWETENGYANPEPVGGQQQVSAEDAKQAESLFN